MADGNNIIMSAQDIERSISRLAMEIVEKNRQVENLALIGIHTGGVFLAQRIHRYIQETEKVNLPIGSLDITLYRDDWSLISLNPIVKKTDISFSVADKILVLIDDVIYTGRTIRAALDAVMDFGRPRLIQLAALVDRGGRELPVQPDFTGQKVQVGDDEHVHVALSEEGGRDEVEIKTINHG